MKQIMRQKWNISWAEYINKINKLDQKLNNREMSSRPEKPLVPVKITR